MDNEGLQELSTLTQLTWLSLSDSGVTGVGLWRLRGLTRLTKLYLDDCDGVTDVDIRELSSLSALNHLSLYNCHTSKAGRNALKAAIPGLTIDC